MVIDGKSGFRISKTKETFPNTLSIDGTGTENHHPHFEYVLRELYG